MQQELHEQLTALEKKVQVLVKEFYQNRNALHKLQAENEQLRNLVEQQNQQLATLMYEATVVKSGQVLPNAEHDLAEKLAEYIQKIDHCIMFLNNQL